MQATTCVGQSPFTQIRNKMFDFSEISSWLHGFLTGYIPEWAAILTESVLVALAIITLYAVFAIVLIYMERKICAAFQCRLGPMRVGPWGTLQVFSDVFKMLTKEIINLRKTDMFLHNLAPFLVVSASMVTFACLPWNKGAHMIDFNVGVFFFLAISVCRLLLAECADFFLCLAVAIETSLFLDGIEDRKTAIWSLEANDVTIYLAFWLSIDCDTDSLEQFLSE